MNYQAFSDASIVMMYEGVRGALAADDEGVHRVVAAERSLGQLAVAS